METTRPDAPICVRNRQDQVAWQECDSILGKDLRRVRDDRQPDSCDQIANAEAYPVTDGRDFRYGGLSR